MVRHRGQKLMDQVAMRAVDLANVVAGIDGAMRGITERLQHRFDVVVIHLDRHRKAPPCRDRAGRQPAPGRLTRARVTLVQRPPFLHRAVRPGVAPAMTDLDGRHRAHLPDEVSDAAIRLHLVRVPDAGAVIGLAPACLHRGFLAEHDAGAADRVAAEVHQLPVGRRALDRGVLAHRRDHDAVARGDAAQGDRCEQQGRRRPPVDHGIGRACSVAGRHGGILRGRIALL
jgi:hypothetical protein